MYNQAAKSDSEFRHAQSSDKEKSLVGVMPQKQNEQNSQIQKVAVNILQDERKRRFALVLTLAAFAHGASRWIEKKGAVVSFAVVVASSPKSQRPSENQERRRKLPPAMSLTNQR